MEQDDGTKSNSSTKEKNNLSIWKQLKLPNLQELEVYPQENQYSNAS